MYQQEYHIIAASGQFTSQELVKAWLQVKQAEIAYVATVYRGAVLAGEPRPDGEEVTDVRWVAIDDLPSVQLNRFASELFRSLGWLPSAPA